MPDSFTVFWSDTRCRWLETSGELGKPIAVIFGGRHQSAPSFSRFKVAPGDDVYVLRVRQRILYVLARLRVSAILPLDEYLTERLGVSRKLLSMPLLDLEAKLWQERPQLGQLLPSGCISEAAIGEGSPMRLDCDVPPKVLERIRYQSRRGERPIKHVQDGKLMNIAGISGGVYRLTAESAAELAAIVNRSLGLMAPGH